MKKLNNFLPIFIGGIAIFLSLNFQSKKSSIEIKKFNAKEWKNDTLGCKTMRMSLAKVLIDSKYKIINKNRSDIISLLGEPNFRSKDTSTYFYFIEAGVQCPHADKKSFDTLEVEKLLIDFLNNKVSDVYLIVP